MKVSYVLHMWKLDVLQKLNIAACPSFLGLVPTMKSTGFARDGLGVYKTTCSLWWVSASLEVVNRLDK